MAVGRCGQDKVFRDNGNFVKTNAWKPVQENENTPLKFDVICIR